MSTRRVVETLVILVLAVAAGWWMRGRLGPPGEPGLGRGTAPPAHDGPCPGGAQALYWKAPMDPTFVRDEPGKSPMGMDLVPACPSSGEQGAGGKSGIVRVDSCPNWWHPTQPLFFIDARYSFRPPGIRESSLSSGRPIMEYQ